MKKYVIITALAIGVTRLGSMASSYISASQRAVEIVMKLQEKQTKADEDVRREEENYTRCQDQLQECYRQTFAQPQKATVQDYLRLNQFGNHIRRDTYSTFLDTAHELGSSREGLEFAKLAGTGARMIQCDQELTACI